MCPLIFIQIYSSIPICSSFGLNVSRAIRCIRENVSFESWGRVRQNCTIFVRKRWLGINGVRLALPLWPRIIDRTVFKGASTGWPATYGVNVALRSRTSTLHASTFCFILGKCTRRVTASTNLFTFCWTVGRTELKALGGGVDAWASKGGKGQRPQPPRSETSTPRQKKKKIQ